MNVEKDIREAVIKYSDMLYKICLVILCNEQDVQDSVQFGNREEVFDPEEFCDYHCMVNAVDGSICGAYSLSGDVGLYWDYDDFVWYEH